MTPLSQEEIQKAKQVSILQVAEELGIKTHKVGSSKYSWRSVENSGLVFSESKNTFFMHSALFGQPQGTGGSTIDLVQMMTGQSFVEAVKALIQENYSSVDIKRDEKIEKTPFKDYFKPSGDPQAKRVKAYLIGERKLNPQIVEKLLEKNYLREDVYGQAIFYWGRHGVKVGASVQGTHYDLERFPKHGRFKGIAKHSESNFGFNLQLGKEMTGLYVFESPIDALSYWTLRPELQNVMLASIDGMKPQGVYNFMNYLAMNHAFDVSRFQVFLGMDNDKKNPETGVKAGQAFVQHFLETPIVRQQAPEFENNRLFVANPPHALFKDWNEELQFVRKVEEKDQYIAPERHQVAAIDRQENGSSKIDFIGTDLPDDVAKQQHQFSVNNDAEVKKVLEDYGFERISKGDLERLGLDAFHRKTIEHQLEHDETFEVSI